MGLLIYSMYLDKRFLVEKMGKVIPMLKCSLKLSQHFGISVDDLVKNEMQIDD